MQHAVEKRWYAQSPGILWLLAPIEYAFRALSAWRKRRQCAQQKAIEAGQTRLPPVVVVGNLSVGGTGKTPVIIALCQLLQAHGLKVGVVSRGYGRSLAEPHYLGPNSTVAQAGDEPLEIMQRCHCDIVVASNRKLAVALLAQHCQPDVILSDDGLQHYRMARALELVVTTARLGFGNGHCLPVGPLREPLSRLHSTDFLLINGKGDRHVSLHALETNGESSFRVQPSAWVHLHTGERREIGFQPPQPCMAYAGIGQPALFFATLESLGIQAKRQAKPDHAEYHASDFSDNTIQSYLMTAKDAVKCRAFAPAQSWYLEIAAELDSDFKLTFLNKVNALVQTYRNS